MNTVTDGQIIYTEILEAKGQRTKMEDGEREEVW